MARGRPGEEDPGELPAVAWVAAAGAEELPVEVAAGDLPEASQAEAFPGAGELPAQERAPNLEKARGAFRMAYLDLA